MPNDLARGAKDTSVNRHGRVRATPLDGSRPKRKRDLFLVPVKYRQAKKVNLQKRKGAGDERPQKPIGE